MQIRTDDVAMYSDELGGWRSRVHVTMPPELFEQYRLGYRCPRCHSPQSQAMPEECETVWRDTGQRCGFKIKRDLHAWLNEEFEGEEELWPDREAELADQRERENFKKRSGIWLPGDD